MRFLYTAAITLALPFILLRLCWRARLQPAYLQHVGERFAHYRSRKDSRPVIWLHAVSVGETRAASPLIHALHAQYPTHRILITHMTPTGRETGEALYGDNVERCYLPYDTPWAALRFLNHFHPVLGLLMETEIWPNLIHVCRRHAVPLHLVNARLSEKSFSGYQRMGQFATQTIAALAGIAAQSEADAARFRALGADHVSVMGNLKFDVPSNAEEITRGERWKEALNGRPVILAASTREGEEALLLEAGLHAIENALLIIVPRHPQRFDEVAVLLEKHNIAYQRRSSNTAIAQDTRVLLGDSMGEMAAYYACSDVAFIGGSLLPFGGQNLIEACALGKPVLIGEHTYNFSEAANSAISAGAALRVTDAADLVRKAGALLTHQDLATRMSAAALTFAQEHTGATQRLLGSLKL